MNGYSVGLSKVCHQVDQSISKITQDLYLVQNVQCSTTSPEDDFNYEILWVSRGVACVKEEEEQICGKEVLLHNL